MRRASTRAAMMGLSPITGGANGGPDSMPNIPHAQRSWDQLSPPLRRALLWLNAGMLLRNRDLLDLAWPVAHSDQRNARKRLREWVADQLIVVDSAPLGTAVRL